MGVFKNLIEPGSIVLAFTAGTLINRRRALREDEREVRAPLLAPSPRATSPQSLPPTPPCYPDNSHFRDNLTSRFLAEFPFLIEIWYWNLTYWVYQLARALTATLIRNNEAVFARAERHALSILSFEKRLHIAIELPVQQYILNKQPWLMPILAKIYYSHIFIGVVFLVYIYTYLPTPTFRTIRRTLAMNSLIAFLILSLYRTSPPRLLPPSYGYIDILHGGTANNKNPPAVDPGSAWTHNRFQLTIAAMPSLHFGTAAFLALCLVRFSPHRPLRAAAPLWPAAMLLTILATANHFVCDAAVGAAVPLGGWAANRAWCVLEAPEAWAFWAARTEKPAALGEGRRGRGRRGSGESWKPAELVV